MGRTVGECEAPWCDATDVPISRFRGGLRLCHTCYSRAWKTGEPCPPPGRTGRGTVPVAPLAEAFVTRGTDPCVVAGRLGWVTHRRGYVIRDGRRVRRYLGLAPSSDGRFRRHVDEETAVLLARAIDEWLLVELGL